MGHLHSVYDTDAHLKINGITRVITNASDGKTVLVQGDHNSERFSFEVPRMVDGHDLSKCNVTQIHYINIDSSNKSNTSVGVYEVDDLKISPDSNDVVILSWLISGNATVYAGSLNFLVKFKCVDSYGNVAYVWNTAIYTGISISSGIDNGDAVVEEYSDVLEQWRQELIDTGGVTDDRIEQAVANYMAENPDSSKNADLSLGIHTDGLVYIFVDGKPVGDGMDISGGSIVKYGEIVVSLEELAMSEGGSATVDVTLSRQPSEAQPVYLAVTDSNVLSVEPATLTFTPDSWNVPQTVTVSALQDEDAYDEESAVSLTSKTSEKIILVTISDDDKVELVTDGLVLEWDFRGLTGNVATDTVGGVEIVDIVDTEFGKSANGISCGNNSTKYASAKINTSSEAYAEFVAKMKEANSRGFTVEVFGMAFPNTFATTNAKFFAVGGSNGYGAGVTSAIKTGAGKMPYKTSAGTSATIAESVTNAFENGTTTGYITPEQQPFAHMVNVFNADGSIDRYAVGYKNRTPVAAPEDFASWDLETALACTNTTAFITNRSIMFSNALEEENYYVTFVRFYDRPLTQEDITKNIKYNTNCIGISTF